MADKLRIDKGGDYGAEYEPTDSEDDYSEEEKELLQKVRQGRRREQDSKKELMAFDESDEDDDAADDVGEFMGDSDIEGAGEDDTYMPDSKDWGNKARDFYNTDFVDQDYGTYNEEEEEMAKQEEAEAKIIQLRLAQQMQEADFLPDESGVLSEAEDEKNTIATLDERTKVKADLTGLTQRERQQLFQKDSPEFHGLIADFEEFLTETDTLLAPILRYAKQKQLPRIPALEFAQLYQNMLLTYCSNMGFYLLLKAKRIEVRNHPIAKRLLQLKQLLAQLKDKYDNIIRPQLEALLERIVDGDEFEVLDSKSVPSAEAGKAKKAKKSKLAILNQYEEEAGAAQSVAKRTKLDDIADDHEEEGDDSSDEEGDGGAESGDEEVAGAAADDEDARRKITYMMAKNKGLMPHRKKELRNPRVKHRTKFRKALIRRKGAVRTVRTETKRYGGEVSGIKATVSKSIKFKS